MNELLRQAILYARGNKPALSLRFLNRALQEDPGDRDVLYHAGFILFETGQYAEALDALVCCYLHSSEAPASREELLGLILTAYYEPNKEELRQRYERNVACLRNYERNFITAFSPFAALRYLCVPRREGEFYIFDKQARTFSDLIKIPAPAVDFGQILPLDIILAVDLFSPTQLERLRARVNSASLYNLRVPVYLLWSLEKTQIFLQLEDYEPLLTSKAFLFWPVPGGESQLSVFLLDDQAPLPNKFIGAVPEEIGEVIRAAAGERRQEFAARQLAVNALTAGYSLAYYQGVFRRPEKVRILFIMNRYTPNIGESIYADDNCIYDCMAACQELGIEHQLYTHKSDIHWCSYPASLLQQIRDFQPHLLFQVNHHK